MYNTQFIDNDELPQNLSDIETAIMEADDCSESPPKGIIAFTEMRSGADVYRVCIKQDSYK